LVGLIWFWRGAPASTPVVQRAVKSLTRESETERGDARWKAQALASPGDWLFSALDHHRDIEGAFGAAAAALPGTARATALRALATLLTGHSIAEEAVLYPALAEAGSAARSMMAYGEQAMAKTELAKLRNFDLESDAFPAKLEELRLAVLHHMYQEESSWFPLLKERLSEVEQARLTERFLEEYRRYAQPQA
jgi:hemerythrin superfamily protein